MKQTNYQLFFKISYIICCPFHLNTFKRVKEFFQISQEVFEKRLDVFNQTS